MSLDILKEVFDVVMDRIENPKLNSYVSKLTKAGLEKVLSKVKEESEELIEASKIGSKVEIIHEAVDLIFHTLILLALKNITLEEIFEEFKRRRR
ncbi:phosphoribosyl-ATP diphosphatase [Candidatus Bathyarchaeota archaeon]|nr:MAG: phosphoribosyl-ATP diphosphatase [Candidatus Bathyarchaeota archaeon]